MNSTPMPVRRESGREAVIESCGVASPRALPPAIIGCSVIPPLRPQNCSTAVCSPHCHSERSEESPSFIRVSLHAKTEREVMASSGIGLASHHGVLREPASSGYVLVYPSRVIGPSLTAPSAAKRWIS